MNGDNGTTIFSVRDRVNENISVENGMMMFEASSVTSGLVVFLESLVLMRERADNLGQSCPK